MKRITCLVFLILLLVPVLASCHTERYELLWHTELEGLTYSVRGTDGRARQLSVKRGGEVLWTTSVKADQDLGNTNGRFGLTVTDLNFDGLPDLVIAIRAEEECIYSRCFLRDGDDVSFTENKALAALANVKADANLQAVFGYTTTREEKDGAKTLHDRTTKYVWHEGELVPEMYAAVTYYSETDMYCYSVALYDPAAEDYGSPSEKWMTPEQYAAADLGVVYYFRTK